MRFFLFIFYSLYLYAQTPLETAKKAYLANINTLLIFTSESGLSSGQYRFTKAEYKIKTYNLPFIHHLEPFNEKMNLFINGGIGYSITRLDTQTETTLNGSDITLTHDNKLQTYTAGLGTGLRCKSELGIDYLGGIGLLYSRVGTSVQPKDEVGEAIEELFNSEYNDNVTYKFFLSAQYHRDIKGFKPYVKLGYQLYETKSEFTLDALSGFTTQSDVTRLSIGAETPALIKYEENYLSLEGYVKANYLQGDIADVVQFNRYINIGGVAYWNTPETPTWAKRFYIELSTVKAEGLEGYNVGAGFSFDY
jgi:hypothetical protein